MKIPIPEVCEIPPTPQPKGEKMDSMQAFLEADKPQLFGKTKEPYSQARQIAAQGMGLRFGTLDERSQERCRKTGSYPGIFFDAVVVAWLCSVGADRVMAAIQDPDAAREQAITWAAENKCSLSHAPRYLELISFFIRQVSAVEASEFTVKSDKPTDAPEGNA